MTHFLFVLMVSLTVINTGLLLIAVFRRSHKEFGSLEKHLEAIEKNQERMERLLREETAQNRAEINKNFQASREELQGHMNAFSHSVLSRMTEVATLHKNQLDTFTNQLSALTQMNEHKLEKLRAVVEERLKILQDDNSQKLEKMRQTVDEKLHATLERRLGESFQVVSDRLEKVHQGLGEMQNLASGVGDLKKVLSNVKTRGILGEVLLGNLLDQILTPEQYEQNAVTKKGSRDTVEFAIKFPGKDKGVVYLPIDSKFPMEDYERLLKAQDDGDVMALEDAGKALANRLKVEAKKIKEKYIDPPYTTDFAVMFLSTEGLYAEVLRRPGLFESLQREFKITVAGPTTLSAILNSLQMGFRTLAVERRAGEVWNLLGVVKEEFGKFGDLLDKTQDKLKQASEHIDTASRKSRTIERKLKDVQALPAAMETSSGSKDDLSVSIELAHDDSIIP